MRMTFNRSSQLVLVSALSLLAATLLLALYAFAQDVDIPFKKFVLKNGLTLIVHEDHKAPIVAVNLWYHVGSANERPGRTGFAHLFNAMSELHHREPGLVGAALAHAEFAELIPDLLHVHPGAIHAALRAIPRLYCVTDATAATGRPDGDYMLGSQPVRKCLGGVRLADGTLGGSNSTSTPMRRTSG